MKRHAHSVIRTAQKVCHPEAAKVGSGSWLCQNALAEDRSRLSPLQSPSPSSASADWLIVDGMQLPLSLKRGSGVSQAWSVTGLMTRAQPGPYALRAVINGWMPRMFSTRVRLCASTCSAISPLTFGKVFSRKWVAPMRFSLRRVVLAARACPPSVLSHFKALAPGSAVISVVTYGELVYGASKSVDPDKALTVLQELTTLIPVLPMAVDVAQAYGALRSTLAARGELIGNNDLWIAAHARSRGLIVVTNNERAFQRVDGLSVENWAYA
jgi:tRNA(fMet)-specific endonuclease VapC